MTKYILSKRYALANKVEGLDTTGIEQQKYIVDLKGYFLTIPPLMFDLLELFKEPITLDKACNLVIHKLSEDQEKTEGLKVVHKFVKSLIKRKILVKEKEEHDFELYVKSFSKDDKIGDYIVEEIIKNKFNFNILKARHIHTEESVLIKHYDLKNSSKKERPQSLLKQEYQHHFKISKFVKSTPKLMDFISNQNEVYIVMEFLSNTSAIKSMLESNLDLMQKIKIIVGCISIINDIHIKGFIHGDIHLGNFMITENFDVYLIDFGLTNNLKNNNDEIKHNGGVYYFLPPERILKNPLKKFVLYHDYKSEIYQLGVLSYYVLYERFPYHADTWKNFHEQVTNVDTQFEKSINKEEISPGIITIIKNMLQKEINLRPDSLVKVLDEIKKSSFVSSL